MTITLTTAGKIGAWLAAALVAATFCSPVAHTQAPDPERSRPVVTGVVDGSAVSFAIRFDGLIDHEHARLTLVMPAGTRMLRARLDSQPNTLFTALGTLRPGSYQLQWMVIDACGSHSRGAIQFMVANTNEDRIAVRIQTMTVGNSP